MTGRAVPPEVIKGHRAEPVASVPIERVRLVLVGGSGTSATDDLYRLLLRRLRISSLIVSIGLGAIFGITLTARIIYIDTTPRFWDIVGSGSLITSAIIAFVITFLLWRRPWGSVRGLRVIEIVLVGALAASLFTEYVQTVPKLEWPQGVVQFHVAQTLFWVLLITWYGAMFPNTWRRAIVIVGILALLPLTLSLATPLWLGPAPADVRLAALIIIQTPFIGAAAAIAIFSSSRIEILRQQAAEARKLGQYMLKERLGAGGMGEVYRAEHALLRRPSAIKLIRPDRAGDPAALRRFEREVQVTATLTHPNTVQIFDFGHAEDGTFYYVMECLPGMTLEELIKCHGPLPPARTIHFLRQICGALQEAHGHGLIHRDIKPSNVMVCERGGVHDVAKVLDFGLVRVQKDNLDGTLTCEGTLAGTPAYMSPEQAGGQEIVESRSDIYSVGAVGYFLLTGKAPFADRSALKMMAAHLYETPAALPADVPADLAAVVMRCLAKLPSERWPDAASLEEALAGTSVGTWSAHDATSWWQSLTGSALAPVTAIPTATWVEPVAVPRSLR